MKEQSPTNSPAHPGGQRPRFASFKRRTSTEISGENGAGINSQAAFPDTVRGSPHNETSHRTALKGLRRAAEGRAAPHRIEALRCGTAGRCFSRFFSAADYRAVEVAKFPSKVMTVTRVRRLSLLPTAAAALDAEKGSHLYRFLFYLKPSSQEEQSRSGL